MASSINTSQEPFMVDCTDAPVKEFSKGFRFVKRTFDVVFSGIAIAIGFIPGLLLAAAIYIKSPGASPIYTQTRIGRDAKPFTMYKFRSMIPNADQKLDELQAFNEASGPLFKIKEDPRIIPGLGSFIRKHSIDELMQIVNVFKGDMTLVGPRPALPKEYETYREYEKLRLLVKPGCSGYWQISGRSDTTFEDMVDQDLRYIQEASPITDLRVIAKTIKVMLVGEGAY